MKDLFGVSTTSGVSNTTPLSGLYNNSTPIKVIGVKAYNLALGVPINAELFHDVIATGDSVSNIGATDIGTGTSLAGVGFTVPGAIAQTVLPDSDSAILVLTVPGNYTTGSALQQFRFMVEYSLLIQN